MRTPAGFLSQLLSQLKDTKEHREARVGVLAGVGSRAHPPRPHPGSAVQRAVRARPVPGRGVFLRL